MLKYVRHQLIEEMLKQNGNVLISKLARDIGVSEETVRRDLRELEHKGMIVRVHGGAHLKEELEKGVPKNVRETLLIVEKEKIAEIAMREIHDGDLIMLDSSTTCLTLAKRIFDSEQKVTIITDSLSICEMYQQSESPAKLFSTSGYLSKKEENFYNPYTIEMLGKFCASIAFISCPSIDLKFGLTDNNIEAASVRKTMLAQSKKKILLLDHTKLKSKSEFIIAKFNEIDKIITDKKPASELIAYFSGIGVEIIVAE